MPSSRSAELRATPGLAQRLLWITAFRTISVTLLLVALSTRLLSRPPEPISADDSCAFALIGLVYLISIGYALLLRLGRATRSLAYAQVVGDIVLATVLVAQTGGLESPFTFVYLLAVLAGAIVLGPRGAVFAGTLSASVLLGRTLLLQFQPSPSWLGPEVQPASRMVFLLASNLLGQFLVAWLSSYLAEQLTRTGGRLIEREADLTALAALHRQILTCMPSGLMTCDQHRTVTYLNRAGAAILGIPPEASGMALESLLPGALALPLGSKRNELKVLTPGGLRILGLSVTPLDGPPEGMLVVFQDLTALRRTEEELRRADHLAALGKLSAQLAHEVRNPLAAMRGSAQLLAGEAPKDGPMAKLSGILIRESDRLGALVEDFLRFARPPAPELRLARLDELTSQALEMLRADPLCRGVKLVEQLEPLSTSLDPAQIQQVLINLLRNACIAVGTGGTVKVMVGRGESGALLKVWDSAGAIASEDLPRVFEPFFSRRPGGTGLGLSTVHSIVRAHGGTVHVSSSPTQGTEFVIRLPTGEGEALP